MLIEDPTAALRRSRIRRYRFRTAAGKAVLAAFIVLVIIIMLLLKKRKDSGKELSNAAKIALVLLLISLNIIAVIVDSIFAD